MDLRRYLFDNNMTIEEFAKRINAARPYLSNIINGKVTPGMKMCWRIAKETQGKVKLLPKKLLEKKD